MSHQTWSLERNTAKGVRYTVKLWPTGAHKRAGMRYRMLRGEWHKTDVESRDAYLSQMGLQRRVAELESEFLTANAQAEARRHGAQLKPRRFPASLRAPG